MTWGQTLSVQEPLFAPTPLYFKKSRQDSLNSDFSYPDSLSPSSSTSSISEDLLPIDKDMLNLIPDLWSGETDDPLVSTQKTQNPPQLCTAASTWQQRPSSWYSHTPPQTQLASFNTTPLTEENLFLLSDSTIRQPQVVHVEQKELELEPQQPLSNTQSHSHTSQTKSVDSNPTLNTGLYKTELCDQFNQKGHCPYGTKCQFAHGTHELKSVKRPSNWKTKPCANWTKFGKCRYGKRCCFKHGDD
ncbi:hypothetical protein LJB42_000956 [Komagataella kurtzmanii]|nr:hypothetical protein LJB42_000956 [Komagataella kurtzmanii]